MTVLYFLISLPLLPIYLIFLLLMITCKKIVFAIIKFKHGDRLLPLDSSDTFWCKKTIQAHTISSLLILNSNLPEEEIVTRIVQTIDSKIINNSTKFQRGLSSLHNFLGYPYRLSEEVAAHDVVTLLDAEKRNYDSLTQIIDDCCDKPLPLNNKVLFELIIIKGDKKWKARNGLKNEQIPLLTRIHHAVGDGLSIMNLITQLFGDNKEAMETVVQTVTARSKRKSSLVKFLENLYIFLVIPGFMVVEFTNVLINKKLWISAPNSGKHCVNMKTEDDGVLIGKIKALKKDIGDCAFTEILLTAISASVYDFFKKKNGKIPITFGSFMTNIRDIEDLTVNDVPQLKNYFGLVALELPIDVKSESMLKRLNVIKQYTRQPAVPFGFIVRNFILFHLLGLFPLPIQELIFPLKYSSLGFSNLPGLPKISLFNGIQVDDIFFSTVIRGPIGFGFSLLSYDNRIHLGLRTFEAFIPLEEDRQTIVDNVFNNIEKMIIEVSNKEN